MKKTTIAAITLTLIVGTTVIPVTGKANMMLGEKYEQAASRTLTAALQLKKEEAKTMLLRSLDGLEAHFQKLRNRAEELQKITEPSGVDMVKTIDEYLARVQALKDRVNEAENSQELKAVAQEIRTIIQEVKHEMKKNIGQRVEIRIDRFTEKMKPNRELMERAKVRLQNLRNRGVELNGMDTSLEECQRMLEEGQGLLDQAKGKFEQLQQLPLENQEQGSILMHDGMTMVQGARRSYEKARLECPGVMRKLKVE